jgi:hypothetical protein
MYLEPSLFVYFAVALKVGEVGDWAVCGRWFAGIPIQCGRVSQHGRATAVSRADVSYGDYPFLFKHLESRHELPPETHSKENRRSKGLPHQGVCFCRREIGVFVHDREAEGAP